MAVLLQYGELKANSATEKVSEAEPVEIDCTVCHNKDSEGCHGCAGAGHFELTSCPALFVDAEIWELLGYAEMYSKGLPPVQGGTLEQSRWFSEFCRFAWNEQAYHKRKQK